MSAKLRKVSACCLSAASCGINTGRWLGEQHPEQIGVRSGGGDWAASPTVSMAMNNLREDASKHSRCVCLSPCSHSPGMHLKVLFVIHRQCRSESLSQSLSPRPLVCPQSQLSLTDKSIIPNVKDMGIGETGLARMRDSVLRGQRRLEILDAHHLANFMQRYIRILYIASALIRDPRRRSPRYLAL